mmetsp:Transcript_3967/g.11173  ORF Transcript_3967/g.11173 Transcript_3967/m.11173 type:complete len:207 (+) Transcript_3967:412-1032(+)
MSSSSSGKFDTKGRILSNPSCASNTAFRAAARCFLRWRRMSLLRRQDAKSSSLEVLPFASSLLPSLSPSLSSSSSSFTMSLTRCSRPRSIGLRPFRTSFQSLSAWDLKRRSSLRLCQVASRSAHVYSLRDSVGMHAGSRMAQHLWSFEGVRLLLSLLLMSFSPSLHDGITSQVQNLTRFSMTAAALVLPLMDDCAASAFFCACDSQ